MENELQKLILKFPDYPWDWRELSKNPNISWDFFKNHQFFPWNMFYISANKNITNISRVLNNPSINWDWTGVSINHNITLDIVLKNLTLPWDWGWLTRNSNISLNMILKNKQFAWDWLYFSEYFNRFEIEWENHPIDTHDTIIDKVKIPFLNSLPNITCKMVEGNMDLGWDFRILSTNNFNYAPGMILEIEKCQKQARKWLFKKENAVILINMYCNNWLWKPGSGINFLLAWNCINKIEQN